MDVNVDKYNTKLRSVVVSESLLSEYSCKLEIDNETKDVIGSYCSCSDFEKNEFKRDNYCCKHLVATFYEFLSNIDHDDELRNKLTENFEPKNKKVNGYYYM